MTRSSRSLALIGLLLGLAAPVAAAEPDLAYGAYDAGHYRRALTEALKRVEADSTDAAGMTLIGLIYLQGLAVPQSTQIATEWFERAAERGDINATYALASALLNDRNPKHDAARGGALMEKAAAAGHPAANYNLALALLATGRDEDTTRAVASLKLAAETGIGEAMYALGILAKQGRGMLESDTIAAQWMAKASATGNIAGEVEYAIMLFNGTGVAKDETAAAKLFLRAANRGNPVAQNRLAKLYQAGLGIPRDSIEAAAWHLAARAQGVADPMLDQLFDRLNPEQQTRAAELAATRIEGAALTTPSQTLK